MKLQQILPQGWSNPRIWPSATHIFVAHNSIWATDAPPQWYAASPCWLPTTYSQPIEHIPDNMPEEARAVVWVRAEDRAHLNEFGHDLREFLPDGWQCDTLHDWIKYIAIDADGEVFGYGVEPIQADAFWIGGPKECDHHYCCFSSVAIPVKNWRELIWQRPTPTQC